MRLMLTLAAWLMLTLAAATTALAAGAATTAAAAPRVTPNTPVTRGSGYVALGDSVTFGYQEKQVVPAPDYRRASTFFAYPEQLGASLHLKVTNLACPGETSTSLINQRSTLACENGYRQSFPLHVSYRGSQLGYALSYLRRHRGVRLVSLMIGANDDFLCQNTSPDHCTSPADLNGVAARISQNLKTILSRVRTRAGYKGQLVVVNYYSLNYTSPLVNGLLGLINRTVDRAARPFHVEVADGFSIFRAASQRFGSQPCLAGLLTQLNGQVGNCGIHPSYSGQALLAQAVLKAIRVPRR
jgi:lysophospholipase L1-like esterase